MGNVSFIDGHIDEVKMTNYERIKSMSVEELADFLEYISRTADCSCCPAYNFCELNIDCDELIKQWLLQEVTDNDNT